MVDVGDTALVELSVAYIAEKLNISLSEAFDRLYASKVANLISSDKVYATYAPSDILDLLLKYEEASGDETKT
jgi:hypothetical protein